MPRLRYIDENEKTAHTRDLIESAKRTGAPDPRVVSLMTRNPLGIAWVEYWNKLLYQRMASSCAAFDCTGKKTTFFPVTFSMCLRKPSHTFWYTAGSSTGV